MTQSTATQSPLENAAGVAGPHATEAFKLLSDEIRLAILLALWEAYDPHAKENAVSFTALFNRVGMRDSGNFSYHLDKLLDHYVEETANGYQLRSSGLKIVRAVIAGSGLEEPRLPPTPIPRLCYHCGAQVELSYEDERLYQICTECEGNIGPNSFERAPPGTLIVYDDFNPAGLAHRTPEEVFVAGTIDYDRSVTQLIRGVCSECSGPVEESVHVCESHEAQPGELCPNCGTLHEARVSYLCSVCKYSGSYPAWMAVHDHPAIVAFYYENGFNMTYGLEDPKACGQLWDHLKKDQTLVSKNPVRIRLTVTCDGAEMYLTLDEDLDVRDISHEVKMTDSGSFGGVGTTILGGESGGDSFEDDEAGVDRGSLPNREDCLEELRRYRWPEGVTCPNCESTNTIKKGTTGKDTQRYKCKNCDIKFNDLTGTLFAGHRLSISEMIYIIREMDEKETALIARQLGRSYNSILAFVHEVRDISEGEVEVAVAEAVSPEISIR